ncbi:CHAT domain-containing protein [Paractinoplanes toevensis]|uniref:CHAT domain-containing protein n=1 Tax=Paractinoplanes toevensis TaxID=571911 RepID=A0A919WAL3_9ACTN|nr:CHAT domain-containing protein [Actinoplanes toevensis]GIM96563.1 CHAT domain-containing protein [Actinoplanes toevensis]
MTAPPGLPARAGRLFAAGHAANLEGRPALAVRKLRAAVRLAGACEAEVRGRLLISLAWAEAERGRVDLGLRLLDQAERLLPPAGQALLHAQRAVLLRRNGRNDLALPEFSRAIAGLAEPIDLVKALNNRGLLHLDGGRVGAARDDLRRAARIAQRHDFTLVTAMVRMNLGYLDVVAGDLPAALGTFAAVRPDYERLLPARLSNLAVEKARALIAAGLFGEADRELATAVTRATAHGQDHTRADALQARAEAALLAGNPSAAGEWASQARTDFARRGNRRRAALADLLSLRARLATVLGATSTSTSGRPPEAENAQLKAGVPPPATGAGEVGTEGSTSTSALDSAMIDVNGPAVREVAVRAGRLARKLRRLGLVEDALVAVLVAARATVAGRPRAAARMLAGAGVPGRLDRLDTRLLWRLTRAETEAAAGRAGAASRELAAGMATLHRYRGRFGSLDLQTGASAHGRDLARAGLAGAVRDGRPGVVFRWSERVRAQALRLPPVRPPDDPGVASALEDLRQTRQAIRAAEIAGQSAGGLRGRADRLQRQIRESAWSVRGAEGGATVASLTAVRAGLGETVLVSYIGAGETLHALVADRSAVALIGLGSAAAAEEAVRRLRADLDTGAGRAMPARLAAAVAAATRRDADAVQTALLDPLLGLIGDRALVVVPTGLLMTAHWAMLPACRGRAVTVAPSATAWLAARQRPAGRDRTLLVAGPGISRGVEEIEAIAGIRTGARMLAGDAATPAAVLAALDGAGLAHLAAHGRHEVENPLFSALDLAGGPLLGYDLPRLRRAPEVVVLASCELGLTEVRPGDETFGMASALLAAGTATVVASVGRVADDAATDAMIGFHRALSAGREPAAALAAAAAGTGFVCLGS